MKTQIRWMTSYSLGDMIDFKICWFSRYRFKSEHSLATGQTSHPTGGKSVEQNCGNCELEYFFDVKVDSVYGRRVHPLLKQHPHQEREILVTCLWHILLPPRFPSASRFPPLVARRRLLYPSTRSENILSVSLVLRGCGTEREGLLAWMLVCRGRACNSWFPDSVAAHPWLGDRWETVSKLAF